VPSTGTGLVGGFGADGCPGAELGGCGVTAGSVAADGVEAWGAAAGGDEAGGSAWTLGCPTPLHAIPDSVPLTNPIGTGRRHSPDASSSSSIDTTWSGTGRTSLRLLPRTLLMWVTQDGTATRAPVS